MCTRAARCAPSAGCSSAIFLTAAAIAREVAPRAVRERATRVAKDLDSRGRFFTRPGRSA